ncbi:phage virion morphogenesis protein [Salmonella enterica]|nr:phage virion morphogenesis protein [Salmonella enterica]EJF5856678.1 phage virion morphogenesis protein [Salmonella enterica]EJF5948043.1 phage virion morphogenesis protein [Salmonella enterica]EJF6158028.1 phage virion morphogenesis protein [Salmonella enterica]EJF6377308.1 phage virion morphogenesis protein [Salmonella enterica]
MSGVTLTLDYRDAMHVLLGMEQQLRHPEPMLDKMGEALLDFHRQRFKDQESPDGEPWQELSARYKKRKKRNRDKILTLDGVLRNTLRWQIRGNEMLFGTDRPYGAIHQFGGTIEIAARSQRAYYRQLRSGKLKNQFVRKKRANYSEWHTIGAYSITIPARTWLGVSDAEKIRLVDIARNHLYREQNRPDADD